MASSSLPPGAFLTTIEGRRCTAVPRIKATTANANSAAQETTTTTSSRTTANPTTALAVVPVAEIDATTIAAEQSSTSTTSSSSLAISPSTFPGPVRVAQAQASESGPPAHLPTPLPAALFPASGATLQSFTVLADVALSRESVPQSSQADGITAPAADTPATSSETAPAEATPLILPEDPVAVPLPTTIEPPQTPTENVVPESTKTISANPPTGTIPPVNNNAVQSTVAVAGGVIGGVIAISMLALFIWWWRRRLLRKRRSTLLTPLDVPSHDRDEKGGYVIARGSIGLTPVAEKVKAGLGQNFRKIRGHIRNRTAPSVNLDRGTSQFIDPASTHSRANSGIIGADLTTKDRLKDWWSRLGAGRKPGRQLSKPLPRASVAAAQEKKPSTSQPDFLTFIKMEDTELDREAQRRRASSADKLLDGLTFNFGAENPFSDANAIAHTSAQPAPLAVRANITSNTNPVANPFTDAHAIPDLPRPAAYYASPAIRRSRSISGSARQPSTVYYGSRDRDSIGSLRSIATATTVNGGARTKFRSDPFDLERPELLGRATTVISKIAIIPQPAAAPDPSGTPSPGSSSSSSSSTGATAGSEADDFVRYPPPPRAQHMGRRARAESFTSRYSKYSKYSSGISVVGSLTEGEGDEGWSDPGPDVGPAASAPRWPLGNGSATAARRGAGGGIGNGNGSGRMSGGSLGSLGNVGKAM
ncbi:hypothetical protein VTI74DRAFT_11338 [Chaetomium olivicolor]